MTLPSTHIHPHSFLGRLFDRIDREITAMEHTDLSNTTIMFQHTSRIREMAQDLKQIELRFDSGSPQVVEIEAFLRRVYVRLDAFMYIAVQMM